MKSLITVTLSMLLSTLALAQKHSFIKMLTEPALKMVPALHGSFYAVSTELNCPDDHMTIRHLSADGTVLKTFQSVAYIGDITSWDAVANEKNNIVVYIKMGDINHLLYEFDSTGNMIWNHNYQFITPHITYTKISLAPTGYYLLGNTEHYVFTDSSHAVLTRLSPVGEHIWTHYYRMNSLQAAVTNFDDMLWDNDRIIMAGHYYYTAGIGGQQPFKPVIAIMDSAGLMQQAYYYVTDSSMMGYEKYKFTRLRKTAHGSYYVGAHNNGNEHALFRLDPSFNIAWAKRAPTGKIKAMCAGYDEDIYIVPDYIFKNGVVRYDSTGMIQSNHVTKAVYNNYSMSYANIINMEQFDCGFLLSNESNMIARTNRQMQYCMDSSLTGSYQPSYYTVNTHYRRNISISSGDITGFNQYFTTIQYPVIQSTVSTVCTATYSCGSVVNNIAAVPLTADIYPNPATDVIHIRIAASNGLCEAILYDMNGRTVFQQSLPSGKEHTLSTSSVPAGCYTLKLISQEKVMVRKLEIIK